MGTYSAAVLIRLGNIIGTNRDKPAIANLDFSMELNKPFGLPTVLGAKTSTAENQNHWMLSLEFGEFPAFRSVVGKVIVGEDSSWNNVRSHMKFSSS